MTTTARSAEDTASIYDSKKSSGPDDSSSQGDITFNQYNSSPKAISDADIYRQTKNQISVAKGVLSTL